MTASVSCIWIPPMLRFKGWREIPSNQKWCRISAINRMTLIWWYMILCNLNILFMATPNAGSRTDSLKMIYCLPLVKQVGLTSWALLGVRSSIGERSRPWKLGWLLVFTETIHHLKLKTFQCWPLFLPAWSPVWCVFSTSFNHQKDVPFSILPCYVYIIEMFF